MTTLLLRMLREIYRGFLFFTSFIVVYGFKLHSAFPLGSGCAHRTPARATIQFLGKAVSTRHPFVTSQFVWKPSTKSTQISIKSLPQGNADKEMREGEMRVESFPPNLQVFRFQRTGIQFRQLYCTALFYSIRYALNDFVF